MRAERRAFRDLIMIYNTTHKLFQQFHLDYRYILFDELIDYFSIFGGLEPKSVELYNPIDDIVASIAKNAAIREEFPFFIFDKPFRELLLSLAKSDGKMYSLFNRLKISHSLGEEIVSELIANGILYRVESKELPQQTFKKQLIKKELRHYRIEPKLYFSKPFYRFWFAFIEPYYQCGSEIDVRTLLKNFHLYRYRLSSSVFEELSVALLKLHFAPTDRIIECGSLWNYYSEFDIYCKTESKKEIIGECKYKNRPVVKSELVKLQSKVEQSALNIGHYTLFSKSGFSKEFEKIDDSNLTLFELNDFKRLLT